MNDEYVLIATRLTPGTHPHLMASTPAIKQKALEALRAVHAAGIIHGDVRSENILVLEEESKEPTVMLLDFGAAVRCSKPKWQKEEEAQLDAVFRSVGPIACFGMTSYVMLHSSFAMSCKDHPGNISRCV
ncbi:g2281 [Coccomyxa elongata]